MMIAAALEGVVAGVWHEGAVRVEVAAEEKVVAAFAIKAVVAGCRRPRWHLRTCASAMSTAQRPRPI